MQSLLNRCLSRLQFARAVFLVSLLGHLLVASAEADLVEFTADNRFVIITDVDCDPTCADEIRGFAEASDFSTPSSLYISPGSWGVVSMDSMLRSDGLSVQADIEGGFAERSSAWIEMSFDLTEPAVVSVTGVRSEDVHVALAGGGHPDYLLWISSGASAGAIDFSQSLPAGSYEFRVRGSSFFLESNEYDVVLSATIGVPVPLLTAPAQILFLVALGLVGLEGGRRVVNRRRAD